MATAGIDPSTLRIRLNDWNQNLTKPYAKARNFLHSNPFICRLKNWNGIWKSWNGKKVPIISLRKKQDPTARDCLICKKRERLFSLLYSLCYILVKPCTFNFNRVFVWNAAVYVYMQYYIAKLKGRCFRTHYPVRQAHSFLAARGLHQMPAGIRQLIEEISDLPADHRSFLRCHQHTDNYPCS